MLSLSLMIACHSIARIFLDAHTLSMEMIRGSSESCRAMLSGSTVTSNGLLYDDDDAGDDNDGLSCSLAGQLLVYISIFLCCSFVSATI